MTTREERNAPEGGEPLGGEQPRSASPSRLALRDRIVRLGIRAIWGRSSTIPPSAAADVPLLPAALRFGALRALGMLGIKSVVGKSELGYDFLCHIGDLAEYPFYHRGACRSELVLCAAWLDGVEAPVVYDVGANVGFFATQLAQMLADQGARIHAFEPVPATFRNLVESVERLRLQDRVHPVAAAVLDEARPVRMSYSPRNSLFAQVTPHGLNPRVGSSLVEVEGTTLDAFAAATGTVPALIKIDVEGSELAVLRGAEKLLSQSHPPAVLFEHNPITFAECGVDPRSLHRLLPAHALYYVDDYERRNVPFGTAIADLGQLPWVCNLFAVPSGSLPRWQTVLRQAQARLH
jgi:FkbM family methyltransferase